jgi:preprotein translocase subunit YajC
MTLIPLILAQETAPTSRPPDAGNLWFFPALMIALIAFMILTSRTQKKREQREREGMYARLAKNDRVLTVGGIIGTVVSLKDQEVVLKVDESTNTKMTFLKSAVQRILSEDAGTESGRT